MTKEGPGGDPAPPAKSRETLLAEAISELMDKTSIIAESASGYRARLIAAGWPEAFAQQQAAELLVALQRAVQASWFRT